MSQHLDDNDSERKPVNLLRVDRLILNGFRRHVDICAWAHGEGKVTCSWIKVTQFSHSKVGHFGPDVTDQQNIVAREISVDNAIGMEKCESQGNVMTDVDLVRNRLSSCLKEMGQSFIHQLHQKN